MAEPAIEMDEDVTAVEEVTEEVVEVTEDATEEPKPENPVTFSEEQQEVFNKEIAKKVAKQREAERAAEEKQKRLEELEKKLEELKPTTPPTVPEPPDPYDDDYTGKLQARDQAILDQARWQAQQQQAEQQRQMTLQAQQREQQEAMLSKVKTYSERAEKLGIKAEELQAAGNQVAQFGIQDGVAQYILESEMGPLITTYLANNPLELDAVRQMNPMQAAVHIETSVKEKAAAQRKKVSPPPQPTDTPTGIGAQPDRGGVGITFE